MPKKYISNNLNKFRCIFSSKFYYWYWSCLDQDLDQPIWNAIQKEQLDAFFFLGDNVYGDSPFFSITKLRKAYEIQKNKLPNWLETVKFFRYGMTTIMDLMMEVKIIDTKRYHRKFT